MITLAALATALALTAAPAQPPPGVVDGATAAALVAAGAIVIDVRTPDEYAAGHIPGARLIPYDQIPTRAAELPPRALPILIYCRNGRRTVLASAALAKLGHPLVYDMQGLSSWTGPIETGPAK